MKSKKIALLALATFVTLSTACTANVKQSNNNGNTTRSQQAQTPGGQMSILSQNDISLPTRNIEGAPYVNVKDLVKQAGFNFKWDEAERTFSFGDNDPSFILRPDTKAAEQEGQPITLTDAPKIQDGEMFVSLPSISELLMADLTMEVHRDRIVLHANQEGLELEAQKNNEAAQNTDQSYTTPGQGMDRGTDLEFGDDPTDPAAQEPADQGVFSPFAEGNSAIPAVNTANMIATAKKYLGVKYDFGAKPYPQSGRFDCSTFTQYIYGKYGYKLPRVARDQAKKGRAVSRSSLRRGDLLFFYVPGRFKTNTTVGHVGIYMGNRQMIHASPAGGKGVQITNIDRAYYKRTFLKARRYF